jgi:hypothetical protein
MTRNQRRLHPLIWVAVGVAGAVILLLGLSVPSAQSRTGTPPSAGGTP